MPKVNNNKFLLLNTDGDSDNDNTSIENTINNKDVNKEKTMLQEQEEITQALTSQATQNKRYRKKISEVVEEQPTINTEEPQKWSKIDTNEKKYTVPIRDDKLLENKEIYDENKTYGNLGDDKKLNSYWTVWVHRTSCNDWKITGYQKIYVINSIGSFWRFFNNFQMLNTYQNNIFIMREEIAPIWEDVNNKFGGICSLKIDSTQRGLKTDLSVEIFTIMSMLIMNETFISNNKTINGISFAIKKRSSLLKIWTKTYDETIDFIKQLPVPLINKFNIEMQNKLKIILKSDIILLIELSKNLSQSFKL